MLVIENLVKKYGRFTAVDGLSLEIGPGHCYGFVGPNGAGKTTTMKIVAGLLRPTAGKVRVAGIDVVENPREAKAKIGYMPDFFGVYDNLKVSEYMEFYCGLYGVEYRKRAVITDQLLELVNLTDKKDAYVDTLSRGMKQRLCLARSLIHDPDLLILDEPASGLDPRARIDMKEILKELRNMGKTILISSHILPELSEMCTSIGIIEKGKMVITGTVAEIVRKISQKRTLKIKVLGDTEPAVRLLQEQVTVGSITVGNEHIEVEFEGDNNQMADILRSLVKGGIPVISFGEMEGSLENIFMQVTGGAAALENQSGN